MEKRANGDMEVLRMVMRMVMKMVVKMVKVISSLGDVK